MNQRKKIVEQLKNALGKILEPLIAPLVTSGLDPDLEGIATIHNFLARCSLLDKPRVLELGTKRSQPDCSTRHDEWVPHASEYLGTDVAEDTDVDIVADIHRLTQVTGQEQFDVIISSSTFEHFKYPPPCSA